jgi:DNA-binding CsgD family transcriptional regulator
MPAKTRSTTEPASRLDVTRALEQVTVPAYVLNREGRYRWLNRGAIDAFGVRRGQTFSRALAPEYIHLARANFAKKLIGEAASTEFNVKVLDGDGRRLPFHVCSVPLWEGGVIIGVFGLAYPIGVVTDGGTTAQRGATPELTARQYETLTLLADGLGTSAIASSLGVAEETARNHIRRLMLQLGAHSRLEAVVCAYRLGLLQSPR